MKLVESLPEDTQVLDIMNKMSDNYSPFGKEKVKIMDNAFNSILENMMCGGGKFPLYLLAKDFIPTKTDFEKFAKMKKFQRYENYPDPIIRKYMETHLHLNFSNEQYQHLVTNQLEKLKEVKVEMEKGISMLFEARNQIYKTCMLYDVYKKNFIGKSITKNQLVSYFKNMKDFEFKFGYEQIFNVRKEEADIEIKLGRFIYTLTLTFELNTILN